MTSTLSTLLLTGICLQAQPAGDERLAWIRGHAVPFSTSEPGQALTDLAPLAELIGDARIVALGEGTHGTREFFQMKHRLLEFLASEMGFTLFSIEASTPEAYALDAYVQGGPGDPKALIGGMYFWTWNTAEVLALVEWMRAFNAAGQGPLHFTGFDMQTPDVAMEIVTSFLEGVDPERAQEVEAAYARLKGAQPSRSFGVAGGSFPVELVRGKRVRLSGWIRTEDLKNGWAGLWWRNDLPGGQVGGFDNMRDRGPRGTKDWAEYTLELQVPEETVNTCFGLLMPGEGKAWFDELAIEIDGQPFVDAGNFDLGFEEGGRGFSKRAPGYRVEVDAAIAHGGAHGLRMESLPRESNAMDAREAAKVAHELLAELELGRELLLATRPAKEVDWAIHNARIVDQCLRSRAPGGHLVRDRSMAENVSWILAQDPDARIVLWAHNGHVGRAPGSMGGYLAEEFGDDYLPVGFAAHEGRYYAVGEDGRGQGDHPLAAPPEDSIEGLLALTREPRLVLDLRPASAGSPTSGWLHEARPFRSIGALAMEQQFFPLVLADEFDLLVYVRTTTPALQLDTRPARR